MNPILRGWGNYFRTGNAAKKFRQIDRYVAVGYGACSSRSGAVTCAPGQAAQWNEDWFNGLGLYRLRGTVRYPKAA